MALDYTTTIVIDLPRDKVVALFDEPANLQKWQRGLLSFEPLSGQEGQAGAKSKLVFQMGKRRMEMIETITRRDLPDAFDGENGARELQQAFRSVTISNRRSKLVVTNATHLLDYVRSTLPDTATFDEREMREHLEWLIAIQGDFYVTLAAALFIGVR